MTKIQKTTDYDKFILRPDNRERINQSHVKSLIKSIQSRNLLELRPISVNSEMEVIDGQHRLLAAKSLGVEIYYQMDKNLTHEDIILMNISKAWGINDYLNFYTKNGYSEYQKLESFIEEHRITLKVAIQIQIGNGKAGFMDFKNGKFVFSDEAEAKEIQICWDTINYIKKLNGYSAYTSSNRFWMSLLKLIKHQDFNSERWSIQMKKMSDLFNCKANEKDYLRLFCKIYNYGCPTKINLVEE